MSPVLVRLLPPGVLLCPLASTPPPPPPPPRPHPPPPPRADRSDAVFNTFTTTILPHLRAGATDEVNAQPHTLVYVPSYFDYARLRDELLRQDVEFTQCNEYMDFSDVSRARSHFASGAVPLLLFSERFHYFRRDCVRGVRHIMFYGLPTLASVYAELLDWREAGRAEAEATSCNALYCRYDVYPLSQIVGSGRAALLLAAARVTHVFTVCDAV